MTDGPRRFWIGVASREHVPPGVEGGFIQLGHGGVETKLNENPVRQGATKQRPER